MEDETPDPTPGQAAYEAFRRAFPSEDWGPWDSFGVSDESGHEGWEAVAKAPYRALKATLDDARRLLAECQAERDGLANALRAYERITTAWTRGMYSARIDCTRGDVKAAINCLSEGLDGYDGTEWNGTETGAEWWERTKAEEGLS